MLCFLFISLWSLIIIPVSHCPFPVIDAPSQVDVRDVTDTTALVTWFQPVANVDGVSVSYGPSSDPSDRNVVELLSSDTQYHLGGLVPDTQYEVSLTAKRGEQTSIPVYESFLTGNVVATSQFFFSSFFNKVCSCPRGLGATHTFYKCIYKRVHLARVCT